MCIRDRYCPHHAIHEERFWKFPYRKRNPKHCHACTIFLYLCRIGNGLFCLVQTIRRNTGGATNLFCLVQTIRSVPRRGFLFYFVKNVDYAEIQVELDGAVEERRTRPIDGAAVRHPRRSSRRESVRNESGRKGEIAPSRPVLLLSLIHIYLRHEESSRLRR